MNIRLHPFDFFLICYILINGASGNTGYKEILMKKKIVAIMILAFVVSTASVFALGIGAQGGRTVWGNSGALTIKPDGSKYIFAVNGYVGNDIWVEGTADYWIANKTIAKPINYYYGLGGAAGAYVGSGLSVTAGARAFVGLNCFVFDNFLEFYLQAAWQPGIQLNLNYDPFFQTVFDNIPVNVGFRIWL